MEVKVLAIEALESGLSAQEVGDLVGVGSGTIHKWRKDYADGGVQGLCRKASSIAIRDLPRLLETGNPEDRKRFVRAFVAGITVVPEKLRLDLQVRTIPAALSRDSTCRMVAGARYEPGQKNLEPTEGFVVGGRGLRAAA